MNERSKTNTDSNSNKALKADMLLLLVVFFWGASYLLMDYSLVELGPLTLNMYRFLIAFAVACILGFKKIKSVNLVTIKYSALIGFILVFVYIGATYGVMYTSLSNAGFLCALTVVFTPIVCFVFYRVKPPKKLILVVILSTIGIALLSLNEQFKPALGDILCIMCALAYAFDLMVTERAVKRPDVDAFHIGVFQLGFTGLFMFILAFIFEKPALPQSTTVWVSMLFLSIFATGAAFIVQAIAQQYTSASHVGVIFTLEPVFAGIVAFAIAGEILAPRAYVGAIILLSSLFIMELDFKKIRK